MRQPSWYKKLESKLLPVQGVVDAGLIIIAIISVSLVIKKDNVAKTAWFVYMISP